MKTKGISFFEQHVEKFVLGATGAIFFSVLVWQLIPTTVKLDGKDVSLSDVDGEISAKTDVLENRLKETREPLAKQLEGKLPPLQGDAFDKLAAAGVSPSGELPQVEPRLAKALLNSSGLRSDEIYHEPVFVAAKMLAPKQFDATIGSSSLKAIEGIANIQAGSTGKADISWIVPSAEIDLKQLRDELVAKGPGNAVAIPTNWFKGTLFVVDVVFEREELNSDGTWGSLRTVDVLPVPTALSFRKDMAGSPGAKFRDFVWEQLTDKSKQRSLMQPDFLPTEGKDVAFTSADMVDQGSSEVTVDPKVRSLRREVTRLEFAVKRMEEELKDLGGPRDEDPKEDKKNDKKDEQERGSGGSSPPRGGLGGGGGGLGGSMGSGKRTDADSAETEAKKKKQISLTKRWKDEQKKLAARKAELEKVDAAAAAAASAATAGFDLSTAATALVWGHDIGVKLDGTYRYRAELRVYNPFFTNTGLLVANQKPLGEKPWLPTAVSEWSAPIRVAPRVSFFVTDAVLGDGRLGVGQATVELYTYTEGRRDMERLTLQPGDAIEYRGGSGTVATNYYLVDVLPDPAAERGGTDRRPAAIAIIQSTAGETYEVRIPRAETDSMARMNLQDKLEDQRREEEVAKEDEKSGGDVTKPSGQSTPPAGRGLGGSGAPAGG